MNKKKHRRRFTETEKQIEELKEQSAENEEAIQKMTEEPEKTQKFTDEELDSLTNDEIRGLIAELVNLTSFCMVLIKYFKDAHYMEYVNYITDIQDGDDPELKKALDYFFRVFEI